MIVYEVNIKVQLAHADAYREWLGDHIRELLTLPGFLSAEVFIAEASPGNIDREEIVVAYRLESHHALIRYLAEHAPTMRARAQERFTGKFEIQRRILAPFVEIVRADL